MAQRAGPSLCAENGQAEPLSPREGVPEVRVGEELRIGRLDQQEDCNDCGFPRRLTKHLGSTGGAREKKIHNSREGEHG
jgi:hypothetical protein